VLAQLRAALDQGRAVHLTYYVAARDESTERDVDPVRLRWADGRWYLEAWCRSVTAMRFFRIDRVDGVEILAEASSPPADLVPARPVRGHLPAGARAPAGHAAAGPAGPVGRRLLPCETASPLPDGRLEVTLRAADPAWMRRLVLGLGPAAEVVGRPGWSSRCGPRPPRRWRVRLNRTASRAP
jgi:proteasome accessory factor C